MESGFTPSFEDVAPEENSCADPGPYCFFLPSLRPAMMATIADEWAAGPRAISGG
jgi:hypothetical protein